MRLWQAVLWIRRERSQQGLDRSYKSETVNNKMGKMRGGPRKAQLKYSRKKKKDKKKY